MIMIAGMKRRPVGGPSAPRALCACAGRGFRRCADGRGHASGEAGWPLQLDAGTLEMPDYCSKCRSSVVAAILGLSPRSLNLRIGRGTAYDGGDTSGAEFMSAQVWRCLAIAAFISSMVYQSLVAM